MPARACAACCAVVAVAEGGPPSLECLPGHSVGAITEGQHLSGGAIHQITNYTKNATACAQACCGWSGCTSFNFALKAPKPVHVCQTGNPCCYLMKGSPQATSDGNFSSGYIHCPPTPAPTPAPTMAPGPDLVSSGTYNLTGLKCPSSTIQIWYPTDLSNGPYPVVSFAHGFGGGPIAAVVESIASRGFVVVALHSWGKVACANEYQDQLHAMAGSQADPSLHPALAHVDWGRAGVIGHSMGGFSTSMAAATDAHVTQHHLKGAVMSHGAVDQLQTCKAGECPNGCTVGAFPMSGGSAKCTCCQGPSPGTPNITIPAMFTTGSADNTVLPGFLYTAFKASPARPKVYVNYAGQYHTTKGEQGFDSHFLACHVAGLQSSCDMIYGSGPLSLCQLKKHVKCEIVKD